MISLGPLIVHYVPKTLITGIKQEHQVVYHARMVRRRKKVAPNVNLVKQECLVRVLVKPVKVAMLANTVQVNKWTVLIVLIQLRAWVVQLAKSCPSKVQPNALIAFLDNFKTKKAMKVVSNARVAVNSMLTLVLVFLLRIV
jgi:hypothetical protein